MVFPDVIGPYHIHDEGVFTPSAGDGRLLFWRARVSTHLLDTRVWTPAKKKQKKTDF